MHLRRPAAAVLVAGLLGVAAGPRPTTNPAVKSPVARAWIVVDAETGAVVDASNEHERMRPASVIKVLTALIAVRALAPDAIVPVSATAASMPAERIGMAAGQLWRFGDTLHALLMASANDAAVALAETVSGSRAAFSAAMARVAARLGAVDHPLLDDPAGLDDSSAFGTGDQISAYDVATLARAALAVPAIQDIVASRQAYGFAGPDGTRHVVHNQNKLLGSDPSAVGVKPGFTRAAGETLVAAASRGGRTMLSVELGSTPEAMYSTAETLLGRGFAVALKDQGRRGYLPPVRDPMPGGPGAAPSGADIGRLHSRTAPSSTGSHLVGVGIGAVVVGVVAWVLALRRRRRQGRPADTERTVATSGRAHG